MLPTARERRWPDLISKRKVLCLWRGNGLKPGPIVQYTRFLGIFFAYCAERGLGPVSELSARGADLFFRWYLRRRCRDLNQAVLRMSLNSPLRAYAWALFVSGHEVPLWHPLRSERPPSSMFAEYLIAMREQRGRPASGLTHDVADITRFVDYLKRRGRRWDQVGLRDIDGFLLGLTRRLAPATVGRVACVIRSWLRFLHATGRLMHNLAPAVVAPVQRRHDQPPRALPWPVIKKLVQAIDPTTPIGRRDRAQFLLMSACGLGAAEVVQLRLEDIDWRGRRLQIVRPKTKVPITLPLLPGVARALADYLRKDRPRPTAARQVFLAHTMPFQPFDKSDVLRHRVRELARRAGIKARILGTHVFRHSHATRQVVLGTPMKTLADILGHRDPESTSLYTRGAVQRLRRLALPVPQ